eukprot:96481-Prymnesium_polylepis.1
MLCSAAKRAQIPVQVGALQLRAGAGSAVAAGSRPRRAGCGGFSPSPKKGRPSGARETTPLVTWGVLFCGCNSALGGFPLRS